jgi:hypothetical protein
MSRRIKRGRIRRKIRGKQETVGNGGEREGKGQI